MQARTGPISRPRVLGPGVCARSVEAGGVQLRQASTQTPEAFAALCEQVRHRLRARCGPESCAISARGFITLRRGLDFLSLTITVGGAWHPARSTYLFPVRALSRHFRGGFVSRLRRAIEAGQLSRLRDRAEVDRVLKALTGTEWVVYSKPCLGRTEKVVWTTASCCTSCPRASCACATSASWPTPVGPRHLSDSRTALDASPPQAAEAKEQTAPFDGYPCPKCRKGRMQVTAHLAPQRRDPGGSTRSPP